MKRKTVSQPRNFDARIKRSAGDGGIAGSFNKCCTDGGVLFRYERCSETVMARVIAHRSAALAIKSRQLSILRRCNPEFRQIFSAQGPAD
jgi:hypothetical protein